jgi:hypothetical protein
MKELRRRDIWPQVDKGTYPIKLEYVLPGKNKVTSSRVVDLINSFDVPQIETFTDKEETDEITGTDSEIKKGEK